jgi:nucleoside-diphosphate-sugar epimerase
MTIAIIGSSGELGFRLVRRLSEHHQIKCIVRNLNKKDFGKFKNIELCQVDGIDDIEKLISVIDGVDVVINASYIWFAEKINQAISNTKVKPKHIIFTGSQSIFTKLQTQGAKIKKDADDYVQQNFSYPWTIIRPTMIFGHSNDKNVSKLTKTLNKVPIMPLIGNGNALIQPVYIEDIVTAFEIALSNERFFNKAFNIASAYPVSNKNLFEMIAVKLKKKIFFISLSPKLISLIIKFLSLFKYKIISQGQVQRFQENKDVNLTEFISYFGFTPHTVEQGVDELIKDMKQKKLI